MRLKSSGISYRRDFRVPVVPLKIAVARLEQTEALQGDLQFSIGKGGDQVHDGSAQACGTPLPLLQHALGQPVHPRVLPRVPLRADYMTWDRFYPTPYVCPLEPGKKGLSVVRNDGKKGGIRKNIRRLGQSVGACCRGRRSGVRGQRRKISTRPRKDFIGHTSKTAGEWANE
jgi:hypothetical protein